MANKDRQKRSVRKARAEERARVEAARAASAPAADSKEAKKAEASKTVVKADKNKKPGFFKRIGNWFGDVKAEMRRVTWPSKTELRNYSVAVIVMLVVFGLVIWLVDSGIVAALVGYTGLRG
ncbi:preprotein translocase subunit SecE [Paratractidigestivibacter sp.]|uniref:preprotein translocase subunit SecE n=1 Tax=Paratractidigestivibacter sp. TaxID=2847316 RepID=UPI002ABD57E3|nr:preprotein translocase subunit SecE [Paratractidigestivibacter sp.]